MTPSPAFRADLEAFCKWLEQQGYLDTDWWAEQPTALDLYFNSKIRKPSEVCQALDVAEKQRNELASDVETVTLNLHRAEQRIADLEARLDQTRKAGRVEHQDHCTAREDTPYPCDCGADQHNQAVEQAAKGEKP